MFRILAGTVYVGAAAGTLSICVVLADRCATMVSREIAARAAKARDVSRQSNELGSRVAQFLEAQKVVFVPEPVRPPVVPMTPPKEHVAVLAEALDRAETAHGNSQTREGGKAAPSGAALQKDRTQVAGYVQRRQGFAYAMRKPHAVSVSHQPSKKRAARVAKSGPPPVLVAEIKVLKLKSVEGKSVETKPILRSQRLVLAETPGRMMSEKYLGRRS